MKLFECQHCGQLLYFENTHCERCGNALGYLSEEKTLTVIHPENENQWRSEVDPDRLYRYCENFTHNACNWLVPADSETSLCRACQLNHTIPNLDDPAHLQQWQRLETAKHRLVYTLLRLGLPLISKLEDEQRGMAFDFLADPDPSFRESEKVITGHCHGLISINIAEADDVERERQRQTMAEPYRTLLGHFRHESGHHYWEQLVNNNDWLAKFRERFGDERQDYSQALDQHYDGATPDDWSEYFVSTYASSHPWEDWAETWAHYLHIVDTLETAYAHGLRLRPRAGDDETLTAQADFDPYLQPDFDALIEAWLPVSIAVNSLNRSMGQPDLYPFVLSDTVMDKLRFMHRFIEAHSSLRL